MRVLITGATGYVGGVLAKRMAAEGHEVTGAGRRLEKAEDLGVALVSNVKALLRADLLPALTPRL